MTDENRPSGRTPAWMQLDLLRRMGVGEVFVRRPAAPAAAPPAAARPSPPPEVQAPGPEVRASEPAGETSAGSAREDTLDRVAEEVRACKRCGLCEQRIQAVPGDGNRRAKLMFIGEGPGEEEDKQGLPFVGPAGKLLTQMIRAMGLERSEVFITNVVKCRPPGNRTPRPSEIAACLPYLVRQVRLIRPEVIVTLGRPAVSGLLGTDEAMGRLRGRWREYEGARVLPTYHPAYLLRAPGQKGLVWSDLKEVIRFLIQRGVAPRRT